MKSSRCRRSRSRTRSGCPSFGPPGPTSPATPTLSSVSSGQGKFYAAIATGRSPAMDEAIGRAKAGGAWSSLCREVDRALLPGGCSLEKIFSTQEEARRRLPEQAALHVQRRIKEEFGTLHRLYSLNPADRRREGACRFCGEAGQDNGLHALSCPELPPPLQEEREKLVSDCGGWQCLRLDDVYMSPPCTLR
eukprot:Polyplicarium_translucidae@DN3403_c1_g1_i1.p1